MNKFTHKCIKCRTDYQSNDEDAYYCAPCVAEKNEIARKIDQQVANRPKRETLSDYQLFNEVSKVKGSKFVNIKDLGITL
jgi:uncharacterized Zn ribbon protein